MLPESFEVRNELGHVSLAVEPTADGEQRLFREFVLRKRELEPADSAHADALRSALRRLNGAAVVLEPLSRTPSP